MRELTIYQDDDGFWVVESKELPGYRAKGKTKEEAIEKMKNMLLFINPCRCEDAH